MNRRLTVFKGLIFGMVLIGLLLSLGCEQENANAVVPTEEQKILDLTKQLEQKEKDIEKLNKKITELEEAIAEINKEKEYNQAFTQKAFELLSDEAKITLLQSEWSYSLQLDGQDIVLSDDEPSIMIENNSFQLTLNEQGPGYNVMNEEIVRLGKLKDQLNNHVSVTIQESAEELKPKEETENKVVYQFEQLTPDTIVKIKITDELKERLQLNVNELMIQVKSANN